MKSNLVRWRRSFNKFRLMKNLRSCPHFSLPSWTGPSPAVFGVWKPSIQSILSPLTPQKRKGGSSTVISCAPIQRWWDQSLLSLPQRTPLPPTPHPPSHLPHYSFILPPGGPHIHPSYLDIIPGAGHLHILLSHHAWVFPAKPLSRFSSAQGQSHSGSRFSFTGGQCHSSTSFPYLVCGFVSSLNRGMFAWNSFLDLHWPGITWKQIIHFLKDSSHVFRFELIFGACGVLTPVVLGAF